MVAPVKGTKHGDSNWTMEGKGKTQLQKALLYTLLLVLKDKSSSSNVAERQYFDRNAALPDFQPRL